MGCACNGAKRQVSTQQYEVRLPGGQVFTVDSEHAARVEVTKAGGGTYSKV